MSRATAACRVVTPHRGGTGLRTAATRGAGAPVVLAARVAGAAAVLAAALVSGCATLPGATAPAPPQTAADRVLDLQGRFSVRRQTLAGVARDDYVAGRFRLHHDDGRTELELTSPFGQTLASAFQAAGGPAELVTADHRTLRGPDLEDVFRQALGLSIPASRLPDWLAGRFEHVQPQSRPPGFIDATDSGWTVQRRDNRWTLLRTDADGRIDVRLVTE